jgi:hypothetical protein
MTNLFIVLVRVKLFLIVFYMNSFSVEAVINKLIGFWILSFLELSEKPYLLKIE